MVIKFFNLRYAGKYNQNILSEMGLIMQAEVLKKLVFDIQKLKTEKQTVELKSAEKGCPTKMKGSLLFLALMKMINIK